MHGGKGMRRRLRYGRAESAALACGLALAAGLLLPGAAWARADHVLAPHVYAQGVDPQIVAAFELLLLQQMQDHLQDRMVQERSAEGACPDADCGARRARRFGTDAAFVCTLTRLGEKHIATLQRVDVSGRIAWTHQLSAGRAEDLDELASHLGSETGPRSNAQPAPIPRLPGSQEDTAPLAPLAPLAMRRGTTLQGPRVGSIVPVGQSFAGASGLTSFAWVWRHQTPAFAVEAVPALGYTWGGNHDNNVRDWSVLDLFMSWSPLHTDVAPFAGAGIGLHGMRLDRDHQSEKALAVTLAVGGGLTLFRTYDFQVAFDARYHVVLHDFESIGGGGAHGLLLSFGLQRR